MSDPVIDLAAFSTTLFKALTQATRIANGLTEKADLSYQRSVDPSIADELDQASARALALVNKLIAHATGSLPGGVTRTGAVEEFADLDHVLGRFDIAVDAVDNLLEKADVCLDETTGKSAADQVSKTLVQSTPTVAQMSAGGDALDYHLIHAANIARPQLKFPDPVDNSNLPFVEKLKEKPNAMIPLEKSILNDLDGPSGSSHPYAYEIQHSIPPEHLLETRPEELFSSFDDTSATWVDSVESLREMCAKLEQAREIAVDLEHHDYRTYQGFVCLVQISTREEDFLIDPLVLRGSLHLLNASFTNPDIVKVFHGCKSDILWLQRDFGVYVVGLFDTYHASHLLEMGSHSLSHLLKLYANFNADKKYQLADWRIRPLPVEMEKYARADTHFLLYIYDRMRNELIANSSPTGSNNLLLSTISRSNEYALLRYVKDVYNVDDGHGRGGWRDMLKKWGREMNAEQVSVFKAVHAWRDQLAREEDESVRYVLPTQMLFGIALRLPKDTAEVYRCCTPTPPLVRVYASELIQVIERARIAAVEITKQQVEQANAIIASAGIRSTPLKSTHIRFDDSDDITDENSHSRTTPLGSSETRKPYVPGSKPRSVTPPAVVNISSLVSQTSALFGTKAKCEPFGDAMDIDEDGCVDVDERLAQQAARHVFASLTLFQPATAEGITIRAAPGYESNVAKVEEHIFVKKDERKTKTSAVPTTLASKALTPSKVVEEVTTPTTRAEPEAQRVPSPSRPSIIVPAVTTSTTRTEPETKGKSSQPDIITISDGEGESLGGRVLSESIDQKGRKKRKQTDPLIKKSERKRTASESVESVPSPASNESSESDPNSNKKSNGKKKRRALRKAAAKAEAMQKAASTEEVVYIDEQGEKVQVKPYDYLAEQPTPQSADQGVRAGNSDKNAKVFDPYGKVIIADEFKKNDPRTNVRPGAGNKSMSFK